MSHEKTITVELCKNRSQAKHMILSMRYEIQRLRETIDPIIKE